MDHDVTQLFLSLRQGDAQAEGQLFQLLYDDLHRLARSRLRKHQTLTLLDTTSLVHEAYFRIRGDEDWNIENRRHFFSYAAHVMRSVIVDFARAKLAERRGGEAEHIPLDTGTMQWAGQPEDDVLRVHDALTDLAKVDKRLAQVVEMRYFGGLSEAEIADNLNLSERTVRRDWEKARIMLAMALGPDNEK